MSGEAVTWAKAQKAPTGSAKAVLVCLAAYADAEGIAWASVPLLAIEADIDERSVYRALARLKGAQLLEATGENKLHRGKLIPLYRYPLERGFASTRERLLAERASPDTVSGEDPSPDSVSGLGVTPCQSSPDTVSPKEKGNYQEEAQDGRAGETRNARFEAFEALEAAGPKLWLAVSDRATAWAAFQALLAAGETSGVLIACAAAYAASPLCKRRDYVPMPIEKFLGFGRWRAFVEGASSAIARPTGWTGPADIRAAVVAGQGEGFAVSWLDPAHWDEAQRRIVCRTSLAVERLTEALRTAFRDLSIVRGET
ncbi:MAG TPA: helix-turn-helix domain-containing protein [Caulobacteraceae bacterium]|jgi:hypothetical protein